MQADHGHSIAYGCSGPVNGTIPSRDDPRWRPGQESIDHLRGHGDSGSDTHSDTHSDSDGDHHDGMEIDDPAHMESSGADGR